MSVGSMLLSGVLVAGGLVLGTFTLHGYLDPDWTQNQIAAANEKKKGQAQASPDQFPARSRFVTAETPTGLKTSLAKASKWASKPAVTKSAAKPTSRRKFADKKRQQPAQQASLQFPWNWKLFGN